MDPRKIHQAYEDGHFRQTREPLGILASIRLSLRAAVSPFLDAWHTARYTYRRARRVTPIIAGSPMPIPDPVDRIAAEEGVVDSGDKEPEIVLYKTPSGQLFTQSMLDRLNGMEPDQLAAYQKAGGFVPGKGTVTLAYECSDERAMELVEQLEALSMDMDLNEHDRLLLTTLRAHLASRYAA